MPLALGVRVDVRGRRAVRHAGARRPRRAGGARSARVSGHRRLRPSSTSCSRCSGGRRARSRSRSPTSSATTASVAVAIPAGRYGSVCVRAEGQTHEFTATATVDVAGRHDGRRHCGCRQRADRRAGPSRPRHRRAGRGSALEGTKVLDGLFNFIGGGVLVVFVAIVIVGAAVRLPRQPLQGGRRRTRP